MNASLVINQELNGLELYFPDKPAESILSKLGSNKRWRYHRQKKCWYARQNDENQAFANHLLSEVADAVSAIEAKPPYIPPYDHVDGTPIYQSSNLSCWEHDKGYFQDIKAYMEIRPQSISIYDLRQALVPGGECERLILEQCDQYAPGCLHDGLNSFGEVYEKYFVRREMSGSKVYTSKLMGWRVFTPFKEIKPIRTPDKWTLPHVWKAILAGQIYQGRVDGRYTDDYAYDAAVNFREGLALHLPSFARMLIEDPFGWYVYPDKDKSDGKSVKLSVNCHGYNLNTLWFDESCDWAETARRNEKRVCDQTEHNAALENQLLSYDMCDAATRSDAVYDVRYIEMNDNTGCYETRDALMFQKNILSSHMLLHDVIGIEQHEVLPNDLYIIECADDLIKEDTRIIQTSDNPVVSGMALQELLGDTVKAGHIERVSPYRLSWALLHENLADWRDGHIQDLFHPVPKALFIESIARLDKEEVRVNGRS